MGHSLQELEARIRRGELAEAQEALLARVKDGVPRTQVWQIATLARRANLDAVAARLLHPLVRPSGRSSAVATEKERIEYAAVLARFGATEESLALLTPADPEKFPETLLYRSFALVAQWNYPASEPLLRRYIASPLVDEYQRLVGSVNLAAALVYDRRHEESQALLARLLRQTRKQRLHRLTGNGLELSAQNAIFLGDWEGAARLLDEARQVLDAIGGLEAFFVDKWRAIRALLRSKGGADSVRALREVRARALELRHWETVRELDRFEAHATADTARLVHLYFGTPYDTFRRRILDGCPVPLPLPERHRWAPGGEGGRCLELAGGKAEPGLKPGSAPHRLLTVLTSDFYRPFRIAALHAYLYPKEFFNPESSPPRVHQVITRLRGWFSANAWPLEIEEVEGAYRLSATAPVALELSRQALLGDRRDWSLARLRERFGNDPFSIQQAGVLLELSPRSALRILEPALDEGQVERTGKGRAIRYLFSRRP